MVRAALTPVSVLASPFTLPVAADSADFAFAAADNVNGNDFAFTGRELLLVFNSAGAPGTVTITSSADRLGRTGDITAYSVGAGEYAAFLPGQLEGWRQSDGKIWLAVSAATMKFAVLRLPSIA